jgi:lipid-A-disaccharide synthase
VTPTSADNPPPVPPGVLFTSFEPSGDDHASAVIRELKRRRPGLRVYAWGGPKMAAAGAEIVERTGENAVMGVPGIGKIVEHVAIHRRVARWMDKGLAGLHVPVDSPAANFPLCRLAKARGLKVVHLVAPQVWAWAGWRIKKLRRRTDLVLCLLPFEEEWFQARAVKARFVGHPLFDHPLDEAALEARAAKLPGREGTPRIALMPGSRPKEMVRCFPVLLDAFNRLKRDFPGATGMVAATRPDTARRLEELAAAHGGWPAGLSMTWGDTDAVVRWCDYALVVSGTVTLQIARQQRPMVAMYSPGWLMYQTLGRWLVSTDLFTLPNLIAGRRVVPEFIPHFGDGEALAVEVIKLMRRPGYADEQRENLAAIARRFAGRQCTVGAADEIERMLGLARTGGSAGAA